MDGARPRLTLKLSDPFDVRVYDDFLPEAQYKVLESTFPTHGFRKLGGIGDKLHLNRSHAEFDDFLEKNSIWRDFVSWCQDGSLEACVRETIDIGKITSFRFEFSILPSAGGFIYPHPDTRKKRATVVFYFPPPLWRKEWGGGFEILTVDEKTARPGKATWDEVQTFKVVDYLANRCVMMKKTHLSFHCVRPIGGPPGFQRRSVTVNLCGEKT